MQGLKGKKEVMEHRQTVTRPRKGTPGFGVHLRIFKFTKNDKKIKTAQNVDTWDEQRDS